MSSHHLDKALHRFTWVQMNTTKRYRIPADMLFMRMITFGYLCFSCLFNLNASVSLQDPNSLTAASCIIMNVKRLSGDEAYRAWDAVAKKMLDNSDGPFQPLLISACLGPLA